MKNWKKVSLLAMLMLALLVPSLCVSATESADEELWIQDVPEPQDYAYSIAVLGDIHKMTYFYPKLLNIPFTWIRDNVESKNIQFVVGLGDLTEKNLELEYQMVNKAYDIIRPVVPFSIIRGNHDRSGQPPETFTEFITQELYGDQITGSYDDTMYNTYRIVQVGKVKYLFLNLDYIFEDEVIAWANEVVSQNPDCQVVVSTHIYLYNADQVVPKEKLVRWGSEQTGDELWEKFLSRHENIVLVLCGHVGVHNIVYNQKEGYNGNIVTQMIVNPQSIDMEEGGTGMVAMFYFSEDGKELEVQYYSTVKDAFYKSNNQFKLTLDTPDLPDLPVEDDVAGGEDQSVQFSRTGVIAVAAAVVIVLVAGAILLGSSKKKGAKTDK